MVSGSTMFLAYNHFLVSLGDEIHVSVNPLKGMRLKRSLWFHDSRVSIMRNTLHWIGDSFFYTFVFSEVKMSLLKLDRFWISSSIQTSSINLPELCSKPSAKDWLCFYYDAYRLIQIAVAQNCLKFVFSDFFHMGI